MQALKILMIKNTNPILVFLWVTVVLLIITSPLSEADKIMPNFIIINMDDLAWADTSMGMIDEQPLSTNNLCRVPNFEKITARGICFHGDCQAPIIEVPVLARHLA